MRRSLKKIACGFALLLLLVVTPLGRIIFLVLAWVFIVWLAFRLLRCLLE